MDIVPVTEGIVEPERISPEGLEVANSYLITNDIVLTSQELGLSRDMIADQLNNPLVKRYIDTVFMDTGYRNKNTLASALDDVINKKLEEMEEAEISSSKDISELLTIAHKMRMDELKMQLEIKKLEAAQKKAETVIHTGPTVNIQDNSMGGDGSYGKLMQQLLGLDNAEKKT